METYLHLEFLDIENKYFNYLNVNSETIKIEKIYEDIKINSTTNKEHYLDKIKLFNNENDFVEHNIDIYINQTNNYTCLISPNPKQALFNSCLGLIKSTVLTLL